MEGCIFALSMDSQLSIAEQSRIKEEWEGLWAEDGELAPKLVILPSGSKLDKHDSLPGRYAYSRRDGDSQCTVTFQDLDEMMEFIRRDNGEEERNDPGGSYGTT